MSGIPEGRVGQIAHAGRQGTKTIYEGVSFCCLRVDAYLVMFQVSYLHCRVQDSVFALEGTLCFLSCCCCQTAECSLCLYSQSTMSLAGYWHVAVFDGRVCGKLQKLRNCSVFCGQLGFCFGSYHNTSRSKTANTLMVLTWQSRAVPPEHCLLEVRQRRRRFCREERKSKSDTRNIRSP